VDSTNTGRSGQVSLYVIVVLYVIPIYYTTSITLFILPVFYEFI